MLTSNFLIMTSNAIQATYISIVSGEIRPTQCRWHSSLIVACLKYAHLDILFGTGLCCRTFVLIRVPAPIDKVPTTGRATVYKDQTSVTGTRTLCRWLVLLSLHLTSSLLMDFLRACVLCTALFALAEAFTHQDMKEALLQKLGLDEVPKIHKRDLENLVIPARIKNKYMSMLKLHHSRKRRSLPSLAGILRGIPGNAGKNLWHYVKYLINP